MTNKITLTPTMRALLVKEICNNMDIIDYSMRILFLCLEPDIRNTYTCNCPYCFGRNTFTITRNTGACYCTECKHQGDFLDLVAKRKNEDLNGVLQFLTGYLEEAQRWKTAYAGV